MESKFIINVILISSIFIASINAYNLYKYQNDFPSKIEDDDADEEFDGVLVVKTEKTKIDANKNEDNFIINSLNELKKKIFNLEENETKLKNELEMTKNELKRKNEEKPRVLVIEETKKQEKKEQNYKSDLEGFWSIICKISKSMLNSFLKFFGVHL